MILTGHGVCSLARDCPFTMKPSDRSFMKDTKKSRRFFKITETKTVTRKMFLFCRKALRNVELLKDLDWPLFQITGMYFAKIVGFALE